MPKLLINNPDGTQAKYGLNGNSFTIGRAGDNDIILPPGAASSHHAVIRMNETGDFTVSDLDSTNKTQVNGRPVQTSPLRHGDALLFGDVPAFYFSEIPASAPYFEDQPTQIYERPGLTTQVKPPAVARQGGPAPPVVIVTPPAQGIHRPAARRPAGGNGCFTLLVMTLILPTAFFCGLVARHHQTTGQWFWEYLRNHIHS